MTKVEIEIENDSRFRQQVEDGSSDPLTTIDVYVDGEHVKGGSSYATLTLVEALDAVEGIIDNEKRVIEYSGGPSYLVFEPWDDKTVSITGCGSLEAAENPDKRLSIDTTVEVDKHSWIVELLRTAQEYHDRLIELNDDIEDSESVQRLKNRISDVEDQMEELEDE